MRRALYGVFWILIFLLLTLSPFFVMMVGAVRPGRGFWTELSVSLGFAGLAMMGLQFLLTARYRGMTSPYGIDVVYHFHRQISLVIIFMVLAHPLILFIDRPNTIEYLNIFTASWAARFGVFGLLSLAFVIFASLFRKQFRITYEPWRISHGIMGTLAIIFTRAHLVSVGYYADTAAKQMVWVVLHGGIWVGALLFVRVIKPLMMLRRPYKVDQVRPEKGNVYSLVLKPDGHKGMEFKPGQFVWLTIWNSPFSMKEHPFSFSSSAMVDGRYELAIKELGDFTSKVKTIKPGTKAYLDGPYGVFSMDYHHSPGYVFLAGGIGIGPIMSMLRTAKDRRDKRPLVLIYGSKNLDELTFHEEIDRLKGDLNLRVVYVLEDPPEGWEGETGYVTPELLARHLPENRLDLEYFICGPEPMIDAVENGLVRLGISLEQTQAERFNLV
ncbi:MAG: ferric reductase-like transmembrane domain-containing protein [Anaerolineales bacterium]|nr:ferric reductase-like transmembrane domain-containing protein [Anaerolineales bacterium]